MKSLVVIPARWNSTRFPGKPLHTIAGKPLLRHVWERAQRADVDAVIVATDDKRIFEAARTWGTQAAHTSPKHASGTDRVAEVAKKNKQFQFVVNVQGDEPLVEPRLINALIAKLRSDRSIGIVTAAHPFTDASEVESPHQVKVVIDRNWDALY